MSRPPAHSLPSRPGDRSGHRGRSLRAAVAAVLTTVLTTVVAHAAPLAGPPAAASTTTGAVDAPERGTVVSTVLGTRQAPAAAAGHRAATSVWGWPLAGRPEVVHRFDPPEQRWLAGHRGIDLAGVVGEPVLAVDDGVVAFSGAVAGVGVVSVEHASGLRSTYQPVGGRVAAGTRVARGQRLGQLEAGGHCLVLDCLHLGARRGPHSYVDPTPLLEPVELSLLPVVPTRGSP